MKQNEQMGYQPEQTNTSEPELTAELVRQAKENPSLARKIFDRFTNEKTRRMFLAALVALGTFGQMASVAHAQENDGGERPAASEVMSTRFMRTNGTVNVRTETNSSSDVTIFDKLPPGVVLQLTESGTPGWGRITAIYASEGVVSANIVDNINDRNGVPLFISTEILLDADQPIIAPTATAPGPQAEAAPEPSFEEEQGTPEPARELLTREQLLENETFALPEYIGDENMRYEDIELDNGLKMTVSIVVNPERFQEAGARYLNFTEETREHIQKMLNIYLADEVDDPVINVLSYNYGVAKESGSPTPEGYRQGEVPMEIDISSIRIVQMPEEFPEMVYYEAGMRNFEDVKEMGYFLDPTTNIPTFYVYPGWQATEVRENGDAEIDRGVFFARTLLIPGSVIRWFDHKNDEGISEYTDLSSALANTLRNANSPWRTVRGVDAVAVDNIAFGEATPTVTFTNPSS